MKAGTAVAVVISVGLGWVSEKTRGAKGPFAPHLAKDEAGPWESADSKPRQSQSSICYH